jgi:hypothetical protein
VSQSEIFPTVPTVIYHQNIRGLNLSKLDELSISSLGSSHIVCLSEHHLRVTALDTIPLSGFKLGARFCRSTLRNGGVCIYVCEIIHFTNIDVEKYCIEKDIEICATRLHLQAYEICVIAIYRALPVTSRNFFETLTKF